VFHSLVVNDGGFHNVKEMEKLFERRNTKPVQVRDRTIGGEAPLLIQSMTCTATEDVEATCEQISRLAEEGCELVRCAVPTMNAAKALGAIVSRSVIPIAADIHFDWRLAMEALEQGVDKLRLNPGNLHDKEKLKDLVVKARERKVPIRVGVNAGSLSKELLKVHGGVTAHAMAESALSEIRRLEACDFDDIVISLKSFDVPLMSAAYRLLAASTRYPFHIGVTEAGTLLKGSVRSAAGIACLLMQGMGDTIRVSLTADPCEEIKVACEILRTLGLRKGGVTIIACPTCGRTGIDIIKLAEEVERALAGCRHEMTVAVMGCVVNGPGEARQADIGIAGGRGEAVVFRRGRITRKVKEDFILAALLEEVDEVIKEKNAL
jgi:(E)-4-hydroxy-3-methylbut-2-enyl-diphosphate synthase